MTATVDNRQFYEETVFDFWASRTGLTAVEEVLVDRFLDKDGRTVDAGTAAGRIPFDLTKPRSTDLAGVLSGCETRMTS